MASLFSKDNLIGGIAPKLFGDGYGLRPGVGVPEHLLTPVDMIFWPCALNDHRALSHSCYIV
jgi:hypothetical protein